MVNKKKKAALRKAAQESGDPMPSFGAGSMKRNGNSKTLLMSDPASTPPESTPPPESASSSPPSAPPTPSPPPKPLDPKEEGARLKEEGNKLFRDKKYLESIIWYGKAMESDPTNATYPSNRSAAYIQVKQFRKALQDIQISTGLDPENLKFLARLARCQLALALTGACESTLGVLDGVAAKAGLTNKKPKDVSLTQADGYRSSLRVLKNNLASLAKAKAESNWSMARLALDQCMKSIESDPSEVPIEWRLEGIRLALHNSNPDKAIDKAGEMANEALRLHPQNPEVLVERGKVLYLGGKLSQALAHLASALRLDPSHVTARDLRKKVKLIESTKEEGNICFKSGKFEEALVKYDDVLEIIGSKDEDAKGGQIRGTLLSNKATTLLKLNNPELALAATTESLELLPGNFKALRTRGRIYVQLAQDPECSQSDCIGHYEKATRDLRMAIEEGETEADIRPLKAELKKAEMELKRSKTKDYYKILALRRDCSGGDIKKAYRVASLRHHPDKGGDEEQFKLVAEAYAVLADPDRRQRYDDGEDEDGMNEGGSGGMPPGMDLSELFAQFHGGGGFGGAGGGGGGGGGRGGGGGPRFSFNTGGGYPF